MAPSSPLVILSQVKWCHSLFSGIDTDNPSDAAEENTGAESSKRGRGKKSPAGTKPTKLPACSLPSNMTPTFYVGGGNGVSL